MRDGAEKRGVKDVKLRQVGVEDILKDGFGGEGREYETRATDVQMGFERWVAENDEVRSSFSTLSTPVADGSARRTRPSLATLSPPTSAPTPPTPPPKRPSSTPSPFTSATSPKPSECAKLPGPAKFARRRSSLSVGQPRLVRSVDRRRREKRRIVRSPTCPRGARRGREGSRRVGGTTRSAR